MHKSEIQKLQDDYNRWVALYPELEKSLVLWKQAEMLMKPLLAFYGSEQWRELYDSFDEPLDTQGNYSILSEDALWNAFCEHKALYDEFAELLANSVARSESE